MEYLPWVLLGLKAAPQEDSNIPSAEMVYSLSLILPRQLCSPLEDTSQEIVEEVHSIASFTPLSTRPVTTEAESSSVVEALKTSSHVCVFRGVSSPLAPR